MISIKNLAGDIIFIDITGVTNDITIFDLKTEYVQRFQDEYKQQIDIDKLMFLDRNGNELSLRNKLSQMSQMTEMTEMYEIIAFISPPYIPLECLECLECLDTESPLSLPKDLISYFSFSYKRYDMNPVVLHIGNTSIIFNEDPGTYFFKYDPIEKIIFYKKKFLRNSSKLIKLVENHEDKIRVDVNKSYEKYIELKEPSRSEVEMLDVDFIFYKCVNTLY